MERRDAKFGQVESSLPQTISFTVSKTKQTEASQTKFSIRRTRHLLLSSEFMYFAMITS